MKKHNYSIQVLFYSIILIVSSGFIQADKWVTVKSKNYGYQIDFPTKPVEQTEDVEAEVGTLKLGMYICDATSSANDENLLYMSSCTQHSVIDIPSMTASQLAEFYTRTINGVVGGVKGELVYEKTIFLGQHEGREIAVEYDDKQNTITSRIFGIKDKMYMIQVIAETGKSVNPSATRFFDSFKVK